MPDRLEDARAPYMARRRAGIGFILTALAIDALGVGLVIPIVPELVRQLSGLDASAASVYVGGLVATFAVAQFLASPVLGGLSDRFGRRPVMVLSILGIAGNYLLLAWAPSLPWLFLGRALAGATSANIATANAYIADVTPPEQRGRRFGLVGAVFSLGFVLGPAVGGLLGSVSLRLPFVVAAGFAGANALFGLFVLPESLPPERRAPFTWRGSNPLGAARLLGSDPNLTRLAVGWACFFFALGTLQTVWVLSTALRFGWGPGQNGLALAVVGVCGAVVQGVLVRRVIGRLGELRTALAGYMFSIVAYLSFAVAPVGWMFLAVAAVHALGQMATPAVRAMVSQTAGPERQGRAMGALSSVEGITAIVSPVVASFLFSHFAGPDAKLRFDGAPFVAAALGYAVAFATVRGVAFRKP